MARAFVILTAFVFALSVLASGCVQENANGRPGFVNDFIKQKESEQVEDPPASVVRCTHDNQSLYFFPPPCDDCFIAVFNEQGQATCMTGGFSGKGDGRCPRPSGNCTVIWQDNRTAG